MGTKLPLGKHSRVIGTTNYFTGVNKLPTWVNIRTNVATSDPPFVNIVGPMGQQVTP